MFAKVSILLALAGAVSAGTIVWDGRFNDMTSSADFEKWSFSTPVGSYQYYIHGSGAVDKYVNLDSTFKNPADTGSKQGAKITIDETAKWNGQSMLRTELIPQTSATINKGKLYYHFSVKTAADNAPIATNEHQIAFFESHFTELKYGGSTSKLQWCVGGVSKWEVELVADQWHNVAYEIDFDASSVTFWHSTGSSPLTKTAGPFTTTAASDGKDFHIGVLRLPGSNDAAGAEDWFFSGVYIESGDLTTSFTGAGDSAGSEKPMVTSIVAPASSTVAAAPSTLVTRVASKAVSVETPVASSASATVSTVVTIETPAATTIPAVDPSVAPISTATPVAPVTTTTLASAPTASVGVGSDAVLPEKFTIKQFIVWLKAKQGMN
ncbi:hypothetical protein BDU57DRAFT_448525 [Ampelomyces quisqualis]|uniref:Glycoside hydrolase 131 catalytic N-terminal domain-containing protein n=1 Tax=Ampelomyces quisqualis TaxID=50730 RepID=A0A6A5QRL4_AMPQU|nr:hypothetical protein BDU57DRAFT_448525 [Ampelomyces quisqualis]